MTKRPHGCRTPTVQSHSIGGDKVHPYVTHASLNPCEYKTQMASRSVQPFLQGSLLWRTNRHAMLLGL